MATITFLTLPPEIHIDIATYCGTGDLHNLCLTSKLINERFCHALYRHVDLQINPDDALNRRVGVLLNPDDDGNYRKYLRTRNVCKRQKQFVYALLSHPEYGRHVRSLKTNTFISRSGNVFADEYTSRVDFWRAMQSLTHVQSLDLRSSFPIGTAVETSYIPNDLFQTATSIRLTGGLKYGLAKLILNAINPAMLKHLCLNLVQEYWIEQRGAVDAYLLGTPPGLLMTLTGRCTGLRTLILRRKGQHHNFYGNHPKYFRCPQIEVAVDEESYLEWASFIRSVQGTVEELTFEQVGPKSPSHMTVAPQDLEFRIMDDRFLRLILPMILSGDWPCLTWMELRGVRAVNGQAGKAGLIKQLRAVLGGDAKIVVEEST